LAKRSDGAKTRAEEECELNILEGNINKYCKVWTIVYLPNTSKNIGSINKLITS